MGATGRPGATILIAEDDDDDYFLTGQALKEAGIPADLRRVSDGEELLDYLLHRKRFSNGDAAPPPSLILLDLNMPRMDGREALREIKGNPRLRHLPIVVLTTSKADEDVVRSYELGVNSFITKPLTFKALVEAIQVLGRYWFEVVQLPAAG
jgi:CheY-like chemotaxis protein